MNDQTKVTKAQRSTERLIDAKVSILQLASELGNIQKACKAAGIARSSFYEIKKAYEQFGRDGLYPTPKRRGRLPHQISEETEASIMTMTREFPSYNYNRIASQLQLTGVGVSGSTVNRVWAKNGLLKKLDRFLWLEREVSQGRGIMTEKALKAIARLKCLEEATDAHVEASYPGELLSQDLYFVGHIKGVGKVYKQAAVDCSSLYAFVRLCVNKLPINSVALVHEKVIPHFDELGISLQAILTDGGREYCGRADTHLYELYLGVQDIEHRLTRPASPWTNGFCERFHRTLKDEFFAKAFREKIYSSVEEL